MSAIVDEVVVVTIDEKPTNGKKRRSSSKKSTSSRNSKKAKKTAVVEDDNTATPHSPISSDSGSDAGAAGVVANTTDDEPVAAAAAVGAAPAVDEAVPAAAATTTATTTTTKKVLPPRAMGILSLPGLEAATSDANIEKVLETGSSKGFDTIAIGFEFDSVSKVFKVKYQQVTSIKDGKMVKAKLFPASSLAEVAPADFPFRQQWMLLAQKVLEDRLVGGNRRSKTKPTTSEFIQLRWMYRNSGIPFSNADKIEEYLSQYEKDLDSELQLPLKLSSAAIDKLNAQSSDLDKKARGLYESLLSIICAEPRDLEAEHKARDLITENKREIAEIQEEIKLERKEAAKSMDIVRHTFLVSNTMDVYGTLLDCPKEVRARTIANVLYEFSEIIAPTDRVDRVELVKEFVRLIS